MKPNKNKALTVNVNGQSYMRIPVKTHVVLPNDDLDEVIVEYVPDLLEDGDIVFVTEKIVAISQGRAYPIDEVEPRKLATFLAKFVTKTPHGIGLGMPETMEMALRECGTMRILFAAGVSALGKLVGRKGDFYRVAGEKARAIDGPTEGTMPPFDTYVVLGPDKPKEVADRIRKLLNKDVTVAIVDINDLGGNILATSDEISHDLLVDILKDNPLGQDDQGTPIGIIRKV